MKKILFCAFTLMSLMSFAQSKTTLKKTIKKTTAVPATSVCKNLSDSFSYAAGMNIAESMKTQGITNLNTGLVQKAMQDVFNSRKTLFNTEEANMTLQKQLQEYAMKKSAEEKAKGNAYLSANTGRKDVTTLPDGLQYEVLEPGDASTTKATMSDTVVVDYAGSLVDGTEFDKGDDVTFGLTRLIRGWTEVLQMMPKGAKWKVVVPSELGYGERPNGKIPANAVLVFTMKLKEIKPAAKP